MPNRFTEFWFPLVFIVVGVIGFLYVAWWLLSGQVNASSVPAFDHSQCQYPLRQSNPIDGCDNSDPADPSTAAKGGDESILPAIVAPAASQAVVVSKCEGN